VIAGLSASADEAAVRKTLSEYVHVFNQKTPEKVAEFWTKKGTHTDRETGERTELAMASVIAPTWEMGLEMASETVMSLTMGG